MNFMKRMFSRSPTTAKEGPSRDVMRPVHSSDRPIEVPADHEVIEYRPSFMPGLQRTPNGTWIANLGVASDEFRLEFRQLVDEINLAISNYEQKSEESFPILAATDVYLLSSLFAPNDPHVTAYPGLLFWVIDADSAKLWLSDPEPLITAVRRIEAFRIHGSGIKQIVLFHIGLRVIGADGGTRASTELPPGTSKLGRLLEKAGVSVAAVPDDDVFFIEVCRPDAVISAVRTKCIPEDSLVAESVDMFGNPQPDAVTRAPRLRRLTLTAIDNPNEATRQELFEELLSREVPLLLLADREGRCHGMSWPKIGRALPVYPDNVSLLKAAEDMGIEREALASISYPAAKLFDRVDQDLFGCLALNVYKDRNTPLYFFITEREIFDLARGSNPIFPESDQ